MLESTTEPLTLDVFRGLTPDDADDEMWYVAVSAGIYDAGNVTPEDQIAWLVHGVAKIEDCRDIDLVEEEICMIDADRVRIVEVIALVDSTIVKLEKHLAEAKDRLQGLQDEPDEDDEDN